MASIKRINNSRILPSKDTSIGPRLNPANNDRKTFRVFLTVLVFILELLIIANVIMYPVKDFVSISHFFTKGGENIVFSDGFDPSTLTDDDTVVVKNMVSQHAVEVIDLHQKHGYWGKITTGPLYSRLRILSHDVFGYNKCICLKIVGTVAKDKYSGTREECDVIYPHFSNISSGMITRKLSNFSMTPHGTLVGATTSFAISGDMIVNKKRLAYNIDIYVEGEICGFMYYVDILTFWIATLASFSIVITGCYSFYMSLEHLPQLSIKQVVPDLGTSLYTSHVVLVCYFLQNVMEIDDLLYVAGILFEKRLSLFDSMLLIPQAAKVASICQVLLHVMLMQTRSWKTKARRTLYNTRTTFLIGCICTAAWIIRSDIDTSGSLVNPGSPLQFDHFIIMSDYLTEAFIYYVMCALVVVYSSIFVFALVSKEVCYDSLSFYAHTLKPEVIYADSLGYIVRNKCVKGKPKKKRASMAITPAGMCTSGYVVVNGYVYPLLSGSIAIFCYYVFGIDAVALVAKSYKNSSPIILTDTKNGYCECTTVADGCKQSKKWNLAV